MAIITEKALIIESRADLEAEMCRYNCQTKKELKELLSEEYNVKLMITHGYKAAKYLQKCNRSIRRVV